jgi:hypothetical protein
LPVLPARRRKGQRCLTSQPDRCVLERDILQKLESVRFLAIEDSAFEWCFDTPRIAVLVSVDGVTHRVSSDASCTGPESATQARFVQVANEIDRIIGPKNAQGLFPVGTTRAR